MAAESQVKATVKYDVTELQEGKQTTVEALQEMAEQATVTSTTMITKSQAMANAAKEAADKVTAADLAIAKAAQAATAAKQELVKANKDVKAGAGDAADALTIQAFAMKNSREAALALAAAQEQVAVTAHKSVTDIQATSAVVRSFEGNPGIRAMENFIGKTLGLGPVMQSIFPIIGATAFGAVLFEMGDKLVDIIEKSKNAAKSMGEAFDELDLKTRREIDALIIQNDKLEEERAKLEKHPGNGLKLALDEARKAADDLLNSLREDNKALVALLKDNEATQLGAVFTNVAPTGVQAKEMLADQKKLQEDIDKINADTLAARAATNDPQVQKKLEEQNIAAVHARFRKEAETYRAEADRLFNEQNTADMLVNSGVLGAQSIDNSAKIKAALGYAQQVERRDSIVTIDSKIEGNEQAIGQDKQNKGDGNKAAEAQMHKMEQANDALKFSLRNNHDEMVVENLNFWEKMLAPAAKYPANLAAVQEKVTAATAQYQAALNREVTKADEAKKRSAEADKQAFATLELMNNLLNEQDDDVNRVGGRWDNYNREVTKGQEIVTAHNLAMQEAALRAQEAMGSITPLAAAQQLAAIHTAAHTARLKELEAELAKLKAEAAGLKPGDKGYEENQTRQQGTQNAITTEKGAGQLQGAQDKTAVQNAIAKPYLTAFATIESGWLKVQRDLIAGNKNIGRDFREMGVNLVQSMAANAEKMLADWIRMEVRKVLMHRVSTMQMTATDAAGSAAAMGISKAQNTATGLDAAKRAFKSTYATVSDWPVVGPVLAPVLAATAFAAVAAFEKGGIVAGSPGMAVPILAHGGERVLTATQTNNFERLVNNNTTGGGGPHIVFAGSHSYSGGDKGDFKSGLQQHRMELVKTIKSLHREGHLKLGTS